MASDKGIDTVLIDPLPQPLVRQLDSVVGQLVGSLHRSRGVDVCCVVSVADVIATNGVVTGVTLTDGCSVPADAVVVAIGSVPAVGWLSGSGLGLSNGVVCDEYCLATPGIAGAGDVASWHTSARWSSPRGTSDERD